MSSQEFRGRGVHRLWHFTDQRNLDSIRALGGLYPLRSLKERAVPIPAPGGNDWSHTADARCGVDQFVHCCFFDDHPMCFRAKQDGRIKDPVWLSVDVAVLDLPGVRFTADVANKSGVPLLSPVEALAELDWEALYARLDWKDPEVKARRLLAKKAEALIPGHIPIELIGGI